MINQYKKYLHFTSQPGYIYLRSNSKNSFCARVFPEESKEAIKINAVFLAVCYYKVCYHHN